MIQKIESLIKELDSLEKISPLAKDMIARAWAYMERLSGRPGSIYAQVSFLKELPLKKNMREIKRVKSYLEDALSFSKPTKSLRRNPDFATKLRKKRKHFIEKYRRNG